jgi:hypothetical protein
MGDEQQTCAQDDDVTPEKENTLAQTSVDTPERGNHALKPEKCNTDSWLPLHSVFMRD